MSTTGHAGPKKIIPRTRAWARIEDLNIDYIVNKSKHRFTSDQVKTFIQTIMNETLELTITEMEEWIDKFVPKRSGDLIESLKSFLAKSRPPPTTVGELRDVRLILGVGADIEYAKYVIDMTDAQVQHAGTWFEHSGKKAYSKGQPVFLDDPHAVANYHDKMVEYGIERLKINLSKIKWVHVNG